MAVRQAANMKPAEKAAVKKKAAELRAGMDDL
jgi:hypothetical protein